MTSLMNYIKYFKKMEYEVYTNALKVSNCIFKKPFPNRNTL